MHHRVYPSGTQGFGTPSGLGDEKARDTGPTIRRVHDESVEVATPTIPPDDE